MNRKPPITSLRSYLMQRLLVSVYLLWLVSTVVGYFTTLNYANEPYDLVLLQRANAIAEQLRLGTGQERLDIAPNLPDGSDPGMPDKMLYTVTDAEGHKLAGSGHTLRPLSYRRERPGPLFSFGERDGQRTRMVSLLYSTPGGNIYQLHVSETTQQRQMLIRGILYNIVIPQLLLILLALAAVWYGLKRGLRPLYRLRREVVNRKRDDLSPLDASKAPSEVRPLIDAVNDLLERLKTVMAAQQRFVADAAHQLRTPLAGLKTQTELALREQDDERRQRILQHVLTSARHSAHLVNQLLMLARNEPGGQGMNTFAPIDLVLLARERTMQFVPQALDKDIDLGFEADGRAIIHGDADSLGEMLGNLIDNALRYTPPRGHVTVSVQQDAQSVSLQVRDDGPGIPAEHRDQVFERFYRILGTGQSGSGLGLAIVAEIAKRHQARIELGAGTDGIGTSICLQFQR